MRTLLLSALRTVHYVLLLFFTFAWALPYERAWLIHAFCAPLMILQWRLNKDMCILSNLENLLQDKSFYEGHEQGGQFIRSVFINLLGKSPSDRTLCRITYGILILAWSLCLLRLLIL